MIFAIILIVGFLVGDVQLQFGGVSSSPPSAKVIMRQLEDIQNISGSFFRSPGESLEKELAEFTSTQNTLDLRTYEFTHKDFKTALKNLAQNDVNVRIIVEDNKYQQFQNTLKVLIQEFS